VLPRLRWALVPLVLILAAASVWYYGLAAPSPESRLPAGWTGIVGVIAEDAQFREPYGVAVARDGTVFVTDGANGNRVVAISPDGSLVSLAGGHEGFEDGVGASARFRTPSGLAVDGAGVVYVADTGNNAIRRVTRDGHVTTIARDLNGPMGIAIDARGRVLVADTYKDRIVSIEADGRLSPLAIGVPLDTPTALTVDRDGTLYVADTGHNVVHAVTAQGVVTTMNGYEVGGMERPLGVALDGKGALYVTDESDRVLELSTSGVGARVLAGGAPGYANGRGHDARFRRPAGIAVVEPGRLLIADAGNALLRSIVATTRAEATPPPSPWIDPDFDRDTFRQVPLLWPLEPLGGPFEVAGTIGEARGPDAGRFHAGIDVRADNGAAVLAVREGVVTSPIAAGDFGSLNEWIRIGALTYVHLRVGRTRQGDLVSDANFVATRDERGDMTRVRVKRGARFETGDAIGSVNQFNHVHLNVGWDGEEYNPLLFRLVQFHDRVPPTIARGGVRLFDAQGAPFAKRDKGRVLISGPVQVVVDAWDQADGNRPSRRLGVYSLGYQVLHSDGTPVPGFETPLETIRFDRLTSHPDATRLVYAPGSGIPFYGQRRTRFLYIVTNTFRDGVAAPGAWDTTSLPPGDYTLRVRVADINGNEASANRDVAVRVTGREAIPGA
jgi:DNA-binding beta-propeller fold protein YncE